MEPLLKPLVLYPIHTFWTGKESDSDILCAIHRHLQQQQFHIAGAAAQGLWFFFCVKRSKMRSRSRWKTELKLSRISCVYMRKSPLVYIFNTISACTYSLSLSLKTLKAIYPIHVLKQKIIYVYILLYIYTQYSWSALQGLVNKPIIGGQKQLFCIELRSADFITGFSSPLTLRRRILVRTTRPSYSIR